MTDGGKRSRGSIVGWAKRGVPTGAQRGQGEPAHPTYSRKCSPRVPRGSNDGFSLLELLLVLFIMGLMTATTMLLSEGTEDQSQYDETKRRLDLVKRAIVGDASRTVNGGPEIGGFVADMGRLPNSIQELLENVDGADVDTDPDMPSWTMDQNSGIGAGWRGPYLEVLPDSDGVKRFRDGWSTAGDAPSYGWLFGTHGAAAGTACASAGAAQPTTTAIILQSCGQGGVTGGDANTLDADYPAGGNLVSENDYQAHLQNWDDITVQISNKSTSAISIAADALRLKLSYPEAGSVNSWPATAAVRDTTDYLSAAFPATAMAIPSASAAGSVAVATTDTVTVPAGSSLAGNNLTFSNAGNVTVTVSVAVAATDTVTVAVAATDTVTVPAGSILVGNSLTFTAAGNVNFPAGTRFTLNTGLNGAASMAGAMGGYSLIVACEDAANPVAVSGKRYDGDCSRYGTDAAPIAHDAANTPYIFKLAPRAQPLSPPSPLIWDIE